mmetsp:Transcript_26159/g.29103  ORF Transcript_26159/g.29103 Transcript_26159/m.29103 type:complete len:338 (-) Transcript_26159:736-1749(-)
MELSADTTTSTLSIHESTSLQKVDYVSDVDKEFLCSICQRPFDAPITHYAPDCGQTFCTACIHDFSKCPKCGANLSSGVNASGGLGSSPKLVTNLLNRLVVRCGDCNKEMKRRKLEHHRKHECLIPCPQGCGSGSITRSRLSRHLKECPESHQTCRGSIFGCEYVGPRKTLRVHEKKCTYCTANRNILHRLNSQEEKLKEQEKQIKRQDKRLKEQGLKIQGMERLISLIIEPTQAKLLELTVEEMREVKKAGRWFVASDASDPLDIIKIRTKLAITSKEKLEEVHNKVWVFQSNVTQQTAEKIIAKHVNMHRLRLAWRSYLNLKPNHTYNVYCSDTE